MWAEQIDKVSKQLFKLSQSSKKDAKKQHKKRLRRENKNLEFTPQYNRYKGWIA